MTFPISFSLDGGNPRVSIRLLIERDGSAAVDVLTGASLPQPAPVLLGAFRGRLEPATVSELVAWAAEAPTLQPGAALPGAVLRRVQLGDGEPSVIAPDAVDARLEGALAAAATAALDSPVSAVRVAAEHGVDGDLGLLVTAVGERPFRLVLFDDQPGYWARLWRDDPAGPVYVDPATLAATDGGIPRGVVELSPGGTLRLPLPAGKAGTGGFLFWRAGDGPQRSIVTGVWVTDP